MTPKRQRSRPLRFVRPFPPLPVSVKFVLPTGIVRRKRKVAPNVECLISGIPGHAGFGCLWVWRHPEREHHRPIFGVGVWDDRCGRGAGMVIWVSHDHLQIHKDTPFGLVKHHMHSRRAFGTQEKGGMLVRCTAVATPFPHRHCFNHDAAVCLYTLGTRGPGLGHSLPLSPVSSTRTQLISEPHLCSERAFLLRARMPS